MLSLYRTLSLRYLSRRWFRALLIVSSIMLGVATLVATQALNATMTRIILASGNPVGGDVDLLISSGQTIDRVWTKTILSVPGVKKVHPRIFDQVKLVLGEQKQYVLVLGVDFTSDEKDYDEVAEQLTFDPVIKKFIDDGKKADPKKNDQPKLNNNKLQEYFDADLADQLPMNGLVDSLLPAIVGEKLNEDLKSLPEDWIYKISGLKVFNLEKNQKKHTLVRVASVSAKKGGDFAVLGGHVVILGLENAAKLLGLPTGHVHRLDVALDAGVDPKETREKIAAVLPKKADIRTVEEQNQSVQSATVAMETGFSMCGVAALIVAMFLVYNSLAIGVAERRHEIGILLSLGATRDQIWRLFAGEAMALGTVGSCLGIPVGLGLAHLGVQPLLKAMNDPFSRITTSTDVNLNVKLVILAFVVGILASVVASLIPAVQAAYDRPVDAVRKIPRESTVSNMLLHIAASLALVLVGLSMILIRDYLPTKRWGTYGGMGLVMIGTLLTAPLCAHLGARLLVPPVRKFFPIEWRLAADNLVRAPGRTGLVIGALAAGVCLVVVIAGIIRSNRDTFRNWIDSSVASDLIVTSGRLGGETMPMEESLGKELLANVKEIEEALPVRLRYDVVYDNKRISLMAIVADRAYEIEKHRLTKAHDVNVLRELSLGKNTVIVSENFAAHNHVRVGDSIKLRSDKGNEVELRIIGTVVDYTWPLGTLFINRDDYIREWGDRSVSLFDIYLRPGQDANAVKTAILDHPELGRKHDLFPLTRKDLKSHVDDVIEELYSIAYGQLLIVMVVAALGMVTALLISVLQRRREMGLLRAIGASRAQVVYLVLTEAFLMGIIGTVLGILLSFPLQWYALQVVFLEESGYYFPVVIPLQEMTVIALAAMLIATLAGLGPALYAVRQRIPDAIAYE